MKIRKDGSLWVVSVEPNELELTASKTYPYGATIGTINSRGTINVWRPTGSVPRNWNRLVRYKLEDARQSLYERGEIIDTKAVKARKRERETGDFLVKVYGQSIGKRKATTEWSRFHEFPRASKWAENQLRLKSPGSYAAFYRTLPEGSTYKGEGSPWTEPFQVFEIDNYGHIKMAVIHGRHPLHKYPGEKKRPGRDPRKVARITTETQVVRTGPYEWEVGTRKFKTLQGAEGYWRRQTIAERSRLEREGPPWRR